MKCRKGFEVSAGEKGIRSSPCGQAKGATASIPGQRVTGRAAAAGPRLSRRQSAVSGLCPGLCVPGAPRARTLGAALPGSVGWPACGRERW